MLYEVITILKSCAEFYVDALQEEPKNKWLVVAPSMSPENKYMDGVGITYGTTMDNQLVFDVFSNTINASKALNIDAEFADSVETRITSYNVCYTKLLRSTRICMS